MDQEEAMNFQALMAKFQEEEILRKQPKMKPAVPEKPKVLPPPQSPTQYNPTSYLPAGARPSLLTSINQAVDKKTTLAPNVVFKDDKKESKKPLILPSPKIKAKAKGSKEKLDVDLVEQKPKKESSKDKKPLSKTLKEKPAELVPGVPPPTASAPKKKGFRGFKRSGKVKEVAEVPSDSILDAPSPVISGPVPLIPFIPVIPPTLPVLEKTTIAPPARPTETKIQRALMPPILRPLIPPPKIPSPSIKRIPKIPDIPAPEIPNIPAPEIPNIPAPEIPDIPAPDIPDIPAPEIPDIPAPEIPDIPAPEIPDIPAPEIPDIPAPEIPDIPAPEIPDIPAPEIPDIPAPEIPDIPAPEIPDIPAPEIPDIPAPEIPDIPAPEIPDIPAPEIPDIPAPEIPDIPAPYIPDIPAPEIADIPAPYIPDIPAPEIPDIPAPYIPDIPAPEVPSVEIETPVEIKTAAPPVSVSPSPATPTPPSPIPSPAPSPTQQAIPTPPPPASPSPSPPSPDEASPAPPLLDHPSIPSSPKAERLISALSALERADEMISPGKKTPPYDQRIVNALEKARRKFTSPSTSSPVTPTAEEPPALPSPSPSQSFPDLPPIDYDANAPALKPAQVNGLDHRQASPVLEGIAEEGGDSTPELLRVPPPPPRKPLREPASLGPAPAKPARPPTVDLTPYLPPPLEQNAVEIHTPPEVSEADVSVEVPVSEDVGADVLELQAPETPASEWENGEYDGTETHPPDGEIPAEDLNGITAPEVNGDPDYGVEFQEIPELDPATDVHGSSSSPVSQDIARPQTEDLESGENVFEDVVESATKKKGKGEGKKRKGPPKNPYAEAQQPPNEEKSKSRFGRIDLRINKKSVTEGPDEKELKKKEKQGLEKEKRELKEQKEREKREQREKEKKENELKRKFKMTGQEEAMYQAKVTVTTKARRNDLPLKSGDIVTIIRTTNCPKGKWLARDGTSNYGYIAVNHVELDITEMLGIGKNAGSSKTNKAVDAEASSLGSRSSNHYPISTGSFTDDSEEWTCDEDDPLTSPTETTDLDTPQGHTRTLSMPETGSAELSVNHQHSHSDNITEAPQLTQARHEALQKLATFFHKPVAEEHLPSTEEEQSPVVEEEEEAACLAETSSTQQVDSDIPEIFILPPPDLYADLTSFV